MAVAVRLRHATESILVWVFAAELCRLTITDPWRAFCLTMGRGGEFESCSSHFSFLLPYSGRVLDGLIASIDLETQW